MSECVYDSVLMDMLFMWGGGGLFKSRNKSINLH